MRIGQGGKGGRPSEAQSFRSVQGPLPASLSPAASPPPPTEGAELIGRLRSIPEIRPELIRDVERRLMEGGLLTRQAAEQTAAAILSEIRGTVHSEQ